MSMLIDQPKLKINSAAKRIDRHVSTLWRWAQRGVKGRKLPLLRIGGRAYVLVSELEKFIEGGLDQTAKNAVQKVSRDTRAKRAGRELEKAGI